MDRTGTKIGTDQQSIICDADHRLLMPLHHIIIRCVGRSTATAMAAEGQALTVPDCEFRGPMPGIHSLPGLAAEWLENGFSRIAIPSANPTTPADASDIVVRYSRDDLG
jgi:hypothetical protein